MTETFWGIKCAHAAGILSPVKRAASAASEARINGVLCYCVVIILRCLAVNGQTTLPLTDIQLSQREPKMGRAGVREDILHQSRRYRDG